MQWLFNIELQNWPGWKEHQRLSRSKPSAMGRDTLHYNRLLKPHPIWNISQQKKLEVFQSSHEKYKNLIWLCFGEILFKSFQVEDSIWFVFMFTLMCKRLFHIFAMCFVLGFFSQIFLCCLCVQGTFEAGPRRAIPSEIPIRLIYEFGY